MCVDLWFLSGMRRKEQIHEGFFFFKKKAANHPSLGGKQTGKEAKPKLVPPQKSGATDVGSVRLFLPSVSKGDLIVTWRPG